MDWFSRWGGLGHETLVHQQPDTLPHGQGNARSQDQCQQGSQRLPTVGSDKAAGQFQGPAMTRRKHAVHPLTHQRSTRRSLGNEMNSQELW